MYAQGKKALGLCDRCGQSFLLNELKKEWQGLKTCLFCYDPKQPQLEPRRNVSDAISLRQPRPDIIEALSVFVGAPGNSAFSSTGMVPAPQNNAVTGYTYLGSVRVTIT